jgi:hypothetical protein
MTQPDYVPIAIPAPPFWFDGGSDRTIVRPAELRGRRLPAGRGLGVPGPDQGYAYTIVERVIGDALVDVGSSTRDVRAAIAALATKRASSFRRGPTITDVRAALALFHYGDPEASELVRRVRRTLTAGAAHHYHTRRYLCDLIPLELLRLSPEAIEQMEGVWDEWSGDGVKGAVPSTRK